MERRSHRVLLSPLIGIALLMAFNPKGVLAGEVTGTETGSDTDVTSPKTFSVKKEERIAKHQEAIKAVLNDFANFCIKGCKYKISHVKTSKILSQEETAQGTLYYLWDFVDEWKTIKTYRQAMVKVDPATGIWRSETSLPDQATVDQLNAKYHLGDTSLFSVMNTAWELKDAFDANGEWVGTDVTYTVYAESSDGTIRMFPGQVLSGMKETANEMFGHLRNITVSESSEDQSSNQD